MVDIETLKTTDAGPNVGLVQHVRLDDGKNPLDGDGNLNVRIGKDDEVRSAIVVNHTELLNQMLLELKRISIYLSEISDINIKEIKDN